MRLIALLIAFLVVPQTARAGPIAFGVVVPASFAGASFLSAGSGWNIASFGIVNLGTTSFNLSSFSFTAELTSTTTAITPDIAVYPLQDFVVAPGSAVGNIDSDFGPGTWTSTWIQSVFPGVTSVLQSPFSNNGWGVRFGNPFGSGVLFVNTESVVTYRLALGDQVLTWSTVYFAGNGRGENVGLITTRESAAASAVVPEPASPILVASGVAFGCLGCPRRAKRPGSRTSRPADVA